MKGEQEGAAPLKQGWLPIIDFNYPVRRSADTASTEEFSDDQKQPMLSHSPAPPDDNESIRHVYFSLYFWITLETHFRQPTRYSVRQLIVELAATGDYFEHHFGGGVRTVYNDANKPDNLSPLDVTPVVVLRDGTTLIVPYNTVGERIHLWELERERYLHHMYDSDGIYPSDQEE